MEGRPAMPSGLGTGGLVDHLRPLSPPVVSCRVVPEASMANTSVYQVCLPMGVVKTI